MEQAVLDAEKVMDVLNNKGTLNYGKLYYSTNENLTRLFNNFTVADKDVLTVAASGDQFFSAVYRGAKSVDTFDINKLTKYYLYLRKWSILYLDALYPNKTLFLCDNRWVEYLLKVVEPKNDDEVEAINFFKKYLELTEDTFTHNLFFMGAQDKDIPFRKDIKGLKKKLVEKEINFKDFDLFKEVKTDKKYDRVIISNILEYGACDRKKLEQASKNLDALLNEDGEVICSYLMTQAGTYDHFYEADIFSQYFDLIDFKDFYKGPMGTSFPVGYQYKKTRR